MRMCPVVVTILAPVCREATHHDVFHGNQRAMQVVSAIVFVFAMATASALPASAEENKTPCERFGAHPAVFVGEIGEPTRHWVKAARDVQPIEIPALPITVER